MQLKEIPEYNVLCFKQRGGANNYPPSIGQSVVYFFLVYKNHDYLDTLGEL